MGLKEKEKSDRPTINYKARLQKKLYLAQESPEPVFDVSDCNLKSLPSNIFALCKVLRKEALYLNNNNLTNLASGGALSDLKTLRLLNISSNKLTKLPANIQALESLEVLDVSMNQLNELPDSVGGLTHLCLFNVSHNSLTVLPDTIGLCKSLETLDLTWNESLKRLPPSMSKLSALRQLNIDSSTIIYPPKDVCNQGVKEILKFLAKDFTEISIPFATTSSDGSKKDGNDELQMKLGQLEKLQIEKQQDRIRIERDIMEQTQKEIELHQKGKEDKKKLLENLRDQQGANDAAILNVQDKRKAETDSFIRNCQDEEKRTLDIVSKIIKQKKNLQLQFTKEWELDRKADEELLFRYVDIKGVDKKRILVSMEDMMREEILKMQKLTTDTRYQALMSLSAAISQQNQAVSGVLAKRADDRKSLLDSLRQDAELQKSAVAALLEKSDVASWELAQQIAIIEDELAELTIIEVSKKKLESDLRLVELSKNRTALVDILSNLFERQTQRRNQLIDSIRKMEAMKTSVKEGELFWMQQYDKLLMSKGLEMVQFLESLDFYLVSQFYVHGVFHYLPLLREIFSSEEKFEDLREVTLMELGIKNGDDRTKILRAVRAFTERMDSSRIFAMVSEEPSQTGAKNISGKAPGGLRPSYMGLTPAAAGGVRPSPSSVHAAPSAPLYAVPSLRGRIATPSRTSYLMTDCVICLEAKPSVLFMPCGHICCCFNCIASITTCPLCRATIESIHKKVEQLF